MEFDPRMRIEPKRSCDSRTGKRKCKKKGGGAFLAESDLLCHCN